MLGKDFSSHVGRLGRGRSYGRAVGTHHFTAERFLLVGDFYHVDFAVQMEVSACHGEGSAPLSGASLCGNTGQSLFFRVVSLSDRGIQFMAAGSVVSLKFVVNFCGSVQFFFQTVSADER